MKHYAIKNTEHPNWYWSEDWGWIVVEDDSEDTFSIYTEEEKESYTFMVDKGRLPFEGEWVSLDSI